MSSETSKWLIEMEDLVKESQQAAKPTPEAPQIDTRPSVSLEKPVGLTERKAAKDEPPPPLRSRRRCLSEANARPDQAASPVEEAPFREAAPMGPAVVTRPRGVMPDVSAAVAEAPPAPSPAPRATVGEPTPPAGGPESDVPPAPTVDPGKVDALVAELRTRQNLALGAVAGVLAAVVGALVWAVITVTTGFQIGWMAVGIGFLVGGTVRTLGQGIDKSFGRLGAGLALLGCLLGNFFSVCALVAQEAGISASTVVTQIDLAAIPKLMIATFGPIDLLFYAIAVYEGYRFSFRKITPKDISRVVSRPNQ